MTREEAIKRLKDGEPFSGVFDLKWDIALEMAISALSEQKSLKERMEQLYLEESLKEDLENLIKENERLRNALSENKGDLISRQAVEEMIKAEMPERGMWEIEGDKEKETVCEVCADLMQKLSDLPSAENKGEWISHYDDDAKEGWYECSCCHSERAFNTKYCPDCGADMRGGNE